MLYPLDQQTTSKLSDMCIRFDALVALSQDADLHARFGLQVCGKGKIERMTGAEYPGSEQRGAALITSRMFGTCGSFTRGSQFANCACVRKEGNLPQRFE